MKQNMIVKFFTTFKTPDGKQHWSIHSYNNMSGMVTMMKDIMFENAKPHVVLDDPPYGRFYVMNSDSGKFCVIDRTCDEVVAVFFSKDFALDFCDMKNGNELANECYES